VDDSGSPSVKDVTSYYVISGVIVHENYITQGSGGLELPDAFIFPVGLSYDIEIYLARKLKEDKLKDGEQKHHDKIFDFFEVFYARKVLTLVVFVSAIVVAGLADYEFVNFFHNQWPQIALRIPMAIAIIVPLIILGIVLYDQKTNKEIIQVRRVYSEVKVLSILILKRQ
jgi:hypothetical protein